MQHMTVTLDSVHLMTMTQRPGLEQLIKQGEPSRTHEIQDEVALGRTTFIGTDSSTISSQEVVTLSPNTSYCAVDATVTFKESLREVCGCPCHSPVTLETPNWLGNAVGTVLVNWYRNPHPCVRCSRRSCKASKPSLLRTRYYFPWWLCRRFIEFQGAWVASQEVVSSLRTQRTIPNDSQVFLLAQHNNIEDMKRLLELRLASPFDVSESGRTPLHVGEPMEISVEIPLTLF